KTLFIGEGNGLISVWEVDSRRKIMDLKGHQDMINQLVLSSDEKFLASASQDKSVRVWDLSSMTEKYRFDHVNVTQCAAFSEDGTQLLTAGLDSAVKVINLLTGKIIREFNETGNKSGYGKVAFLNNKLAIAASWGWDAPSGAEGKIVVFDLETGQIKCR